MIAIFKKFMEVPFAGKVTGLEQGSLKNGKKIVLELNTLRWDIGLLTN